MSPTRFLLLSNRHQLAPFAWRLRKEGCEVEVAAWNPRYERAWSGGPLTTAPLSEKSKPQRAKELADRYAALEGETVVVADSPRWSTYFPSAQFPTLPESPEGHEATPVRLGAWFDGESARSVHLLVEDRGAWPGGLGPAVAGALTLVRLEKFPEPLVETMTAPMAELKARNYRGLVQVSFRVGADGVETVGWAAGWYGLHPHAFVAALGAEGVLLGAVLADGAHPAFEHRYAVVAPITVPPWPLELGESARGTALTIAPESQANLMLHDVEVDMEERTLRVAGLDGLVGVARGVGDGLGLAIRRLGAVVGGVQVAERQYRPDAGAQVEPVLSSLEEVGLGVI